MPDVHAFPVHIACCGSTRSEIVLPLIDRKGDLLAVLDVDSDQPDAVSLVDQAELEALLADLGQRFPAPRGAEADHA